MPNCKQCGHSLKSTDVFCPECGLLTEQNTAPATDSNVVQIDYQKNNTGLDIIILIIGVIIAIAFPFYIFPSLIGTGSDGYLLFLAIGIFVECIILGMLSTGIKAKSKALDALTTVVFYSPLVTNVISAVIIDGGGIRNGWDIIALIIIAVANFFIVTGGITVGEKIGKPIAGKLL